MIDIPLQAFKFGLGYVLKDPAIKKIFHDVRYKVKY